MREAERHTYLQVMGIDTYVPRTCLSEEIKQQEINQFSVPNKFEEMNQIENNNQSEKKSHSFSSLLDKTLSDLTIPAVKIEREKTQKSNSVSAISSFSLSFWRPYPGMLVIDSRNASLALPTEILLNNILRAYFNHADFLLTEEVLQWPMAGIKQTINQSDAGAELQTWLSVEHEQRPIQVLWVMGETAARHWLPKNTDYEAAIWTQQTLEEMNISALILPSLNELLQQPLYKSKLWNLFHT